MGIQPVSPDEVGEVLLNGGCFESPVPLGRAVQVLATALADGSMDAVRNMTTWDSSSVDADL